MLVKSKIIATLYITMTLGEFATAFVHDGNDDCLLYSEIALLNKNDEDRVCV